MTLIVHMFLTLMLLSSIAGITGGEGGSESVMNDGVSVCTFNAASSIADCSHRNTVSNQLPEASKPPQGAPRLRYDPFPEIFTVDAVSEIKRYQHFQKVKSGNVQKELDTADECIDISSFSTIIDFSCIYTFASEVFHHSFECFMGNYHLFLAAQNHNHNSTILIVPYETRNQANLMPFVDFFLPMATRYAATVTHRYTKFRQKGVLLPDEGISYQNLDCFVTNKNAIVIHSNLKTLWLEFRAFDQFPPTHPQVMNMMKTAQRFQKDIQTITNRLTLQKSTDRTILFIHRSKNRILTNSNAIVKVINDAVSSTQVHGQLRSTTFYGNETLTETVLLFQQAAVVIAFHGAGLINTIYCPSDAVILELSIAAEPEVKPINKDMPPMWRSNHVIGALCQLHWIIYLLRPSDSLARQNEEKHGYLFALDLHTITLLETDITRLATIIKTKMSTISSKSSSSPSSSLLSSPISSLYVSNQPQGSLQVFSSEDSNTITPMKIFREQTKKHKEKKQNSHHDRGGSSPSSTKSKGTVKGISTGEVRTDRTKFHSNKVKTR